MLSYSSRRLSLGREWALSARALAGVRGMCVIPEEPPVLLERRGRVGVLRLNRPASLNAMTSAMGDALQRAVAELSAEQLGAVVLTGAGSAFSAGGDMQFLHDRAADSAWRNAQIMRSFYERFLSVRKLPVPVVAAINGPAIGAGLCLALACDIRVASPTARLGVTFVSLGLHPGMGATHFLPLAVGSQVAARMMLTGEVITGEQALREGLVVSLEEDTEGAAIALAEKIAAQAPVAVRTCVRNLRASQDIMLDAALWREADAQAHCYAGDDYAEGLRALNARPRQPPTFVQYDKCTNELPDAT